MQNVFNGQAARCLAMLLAVLIFNAGIATRAHAGLITTPESQIMIERTADLDTVRQVLENKIVSQRLNELGYSPGEVDQRLTMLSDAELSRLAKNVKNINVGGGVLGAILIVLFCVLIVMGALQAAVDD